MRPALRLFLAAGCLLAASTSCHDSTRLLPSLAKPAPVESQELLSKSQRTATFRVICTIPTPCYEFSRADIASAVAASVSVKVLVVPEPGVGACPQVIAHLPVQVTVTVPVDGIYGFHFWQSDTSSIDTTIAFP